MMSSLRHHKGTRRSVRNLFRSHRRLFGNPLTTLSTEEDNIPVPIQNIMVQLFRRGPGTTGIFRKSALQRTAKQIRQNLDAGKDENMEDTSVIVLAAVIKDFFRSLPDCLIISSLYDNLVGTKLLSEDITARVEEVKTVLQFLPKEHYEILMKLLCVLHHIQRFSDRNNMNSYNLSICICQSIMWPPVTSKLEATEQTSGTSEFVCFLIDNFLSIFSNENEYILGAESEIEFHDGPGEDSDSGTDQQIYTLRQPDDTEEEKYDSEEKENEIPISPADSVFSPAKSSLDSPFAQSDSSLCTNDSDDIIRTSHNSNLAIPATLNNSRSNPVSPASKRRQIDELSRYMSDASDHEIADYNDIFQRNLLRQSRHKRVLSSTTTSAELIEHKQNASSDVKMAERKGRRKSKNAFSHDNVNKLSEVDKGISEIVPKKYVISQPVIKHFSTEYSTTPNVIFHSVDRRRQPAAPSYEEHIQKTQAKPKTAQYTTRKKSIPPYKIQQLSVDDYTPPLYDNTYNIDYKNELKTNPIDNNDILKDYEILELSSLLLPITKLPQKTAQKQLPIQAPMELPIPQVKFLPVTEYSSISAPISIPSSVNTNTSFSNESNDRTHPSLTFTSIDPDSTAISPVRIDSLIEAFQIHSKKTLPFQRNLPSKTKVLRNEFQETVANINSLERLQDDFIGVVASNDDSEIVCKTAKQANHELPVNEFLDETSINNDSFLYNSPLIESIDTTILPFNEDNLSKTKDVIVNESMQCVSTASTKNIKEAIVESNVNESNSISKFEDDMTIKYVRKLPVIAPKTRVKVLASPRKPTIVISSSKPKHSNTSSELREMDDNNNRVTIRNDTNTLENEKTDVQNDKAPVKKHSFIILKSGPFTLKTTIEYKPTQSNNTDVTPSQSLQLKKTCLTRAPKKIDQLTNNNHIRHDPSKVITARELRRTNRRLKNEIRNAFNDGSFVNTKTDIISSVQKPPYWKREEKENVFKKKINRFHDNQRIGNKNSFLSKDESCV